MKNYEFEAIPEHKTMVLHMMDRADKYIARIAKPLKQEGAFVQIHAPEGMPHELLQSLEGMIQNRMTRQFQPKENLLGIISVKITDPYTIAFECSKLWFEQKMDRMQAIIIDAMGLEDEFIELDWAKKQWPENEEGSPEDHDDET